jgi:DNA (cytosine-5)-methyltransferase 3A
MIRFLIGGSPCTHWSIAQSKNRETEAEGIGWELFKNYLIAKERFNPDFFLYENNKSAAQAIKDQIVHKLQAPLQYINSALVSAQNRQRFYVHNFGHVPEPADRGIMLQDILEGGESWQEKAYTLTAAAPVEPVIFSNPHGFNRGGMKYGKAPTMTATGAYIDNNHVIEPHRNQKCDQLSFYEIIAEEGEGVAVRVGCLPNAAGEVKNNQGKRIYSVDGKSVPLCACASAGGTSDQSGNRTGLYAVPVRIGTIENGINNSESQSNRVYSPIGKSVTLCGGQGGKGAQTGLYAVPCRVGDMPTESGELNNAQGQRIYSPDGKGVTLKATDGGGGAATGLYAVPHESAPELKPVYRVEAGQIEIKGKLYPIKLPDGLYIIRKLSVTECCRLQTLPDDYCRAVSAAQAYRGLGNGWTAEVIMHLLSHALRGVPKGEEIVVLSMYDGIGTGRYCFDALGYTNVKYYAYEIDRYAKQISRSNYPDIIQCGNAFAVREARWFLAEEERRAAL